MADILDAYDSPTAHRCLYYDKVLVIQASTTLNIAALEDSTKLLHFSGGNGTEICVHASVVFNQDGIIQGCLDFAGEYPHQTADQQAPGQDTQASDRWIAGLQTASDLANACGNQSVYQPTRVINVGDDEGDLWQYYAAYAKLKATSAYLGFVVRCKNDHCGQVSVDHQGASKLVGLAEYMESMPLLGRAQIFIEGKPQVVNLRMSRVKLMAPQSQQQNISAVETSCVLASFADNPAKKWLLTSSEGSDQPTVDDAHLIVDYYSKRSNIKGFVRALKKTSSQIEGEHDLEDIKDFLEILADDAVAAYRITQLRHMAKHEPEKDAVKGFIPIELTALRHLMKIKGLHRYIPNKLEEDFIRYMSSPLGTTISLDMNVKEAAILLGRTGGFIPTKTQIIPGYNILRRAYHELHINALIISSYKQERLFTIKS